MARAVIAYIPVSHLDLFWLGTHKTCLERGTAVIRHYLDRCLATEDETFLLETVVFAQEFLRRYPEYREPLIRLVQEGRVEVGAAYVDRWEHLVLGESHIRNIQLGLGWYREVFGRDNHMVVHPDLPGFIPQVAQIYAQAGIRYYVTSRKVFEQGAVWRLRAPDGSTLLVLNYPKHYIFVPLEQDDIPAQLRSPWAPALDLEATLAYFPLGTIPIAGGAGDLADRETFRQRYGRYLEDFVAAYRQRHADLTFTYTTPSQVLAPYESVPALPEAMGEAPSVWGIAIAEEGNFFARDREIEASLLTAETAAAVSEHLGMVWLPPSSSTWQGVFYEAAFFAPKDPIPVDHAFRELWRMHVFTHDHNSGGQEGPLSSFLKTAMQERCAQYAGEIIDHTLGQIADRAAAQAGECLVAFNPHGQDWAGVLAVGCRPEEWPEGVQALDENGRALVTQREDGPGGQVTVHVAMPAVPSVGYRVVGLGRGGAPEQKATVQAVREDGEIRLRNDDLEVAVDSRTGRLTRIVDRRRGEDWGGANVGRVSALHEAGNDVALRVDEQAPRTEEMLAGIDEVESGPLATRLRIHKRLCRADVEQTVTLWSGAPRLELETRIYWWGAADEQVRLGLPSVASEGEITCGSPFYGGNWTDIMPTAAPRNRDEVLRDDYVHYKEVQGWLHLTGTRGGLTICTTHPAFHHGAGGLEAVLLRTPVSCGDARLHWQHTGELRYMFALIPGDADWRTAGAARLGVLHLHPPVVRVARLAGGGSLPATGSFLRVDGSFALLSSVAPALVGRGTAVRLYDAKGQGGRLRLSGPLAGATAAAVDMLEEHPQPLGGRPGDSQIDLPPWCIQTVLCGP